MKWIGATVLVVLAVVAFLFAIIVGADPEGRGGNLTLASLAVCVGCVMGAVAVVEHFP